MIKHHQEKQVGITIQASAQTNQLFQYVTLNTRNKNKSTSEQQIIILEKQW